METASHLALYVYFFCFGLPCALYILRMNAKDFVSSYKHKEKILATAMAIMGRITMATPDQDSSEHWDFELTIPIDVKSMKKTSRSDAEPDDSIHWVELINVNGELGWLYGKAMYIAFETELFWIFVHRETLAEFIKEMCKEKIPTDSVLEFYKIYTRDGRKDKLTKVKTIDLMSISDFLIMKKDNTIKTIQ